MRKILIIALSVFFFSGITLTSCSNKVTDKDEMINNSTNAEENNNNLEQEDYDAIFSPNQESLSEEQKEMQRKLLAMMKEHVKIEDGLIYSSATKEDFERESIPLYYHNMLNDNLKDLNKAIKNDSLDPQKFYDEMMIDFPENKS